MVDGRVVYSGAAGRTAAAPDPERTVFLIASISKTLLAVVCVQCAERGELDLDRDINRYLPFAVRSPHFPEAAITARHLLTHCSGLNDDESALRPGSGWRTEGSDCPITLQQYVRRRLLPSSDAGRRLWSASASPGRAAYHYSNAGFTLLGLVVECAAGRPLPALAQDRIFDPLGMSRTKYTLRQSLALPDTTVAVPHSGRRPPGHYGVAEWPAAQLRSTAADLGRFLGALTRGPAACPVLSESAFGEMLPPTFREGLAWWGRDAAYRERAEPCCWAHGGFMPGVRTHIYLWPKRRAGFVLLTNGEGDYQDLADALKAHMMSGRTAEAAHEPERPQLQKQQQQEPEAVALEAALRRNAEERDAAFWRKVEAEEGAGITRKDTRPAHLRNLFRGGRTAAGGGEEGAPAAREEAGEDGKAAGGDAGLLQEQRQERQQELPVRGREEAECKLVYVTGYNAAGKTTLGEHLAQAHDGWDCIDGDHFVEDDPENGELRSYLRNCGSVLKLMRGTFGSENLVAEVKAHEAEAEVRAYWEPFFRLLFEKLKQRTKQQRKVVFVYHCWRLWTLDVLREYFPAVKIVEVEVQKEMLLDRYVQRQVKEGVNHQEAWASPKASAELAMLREKYGPVYKGNEAHFKDYCWWRYFFYREPILAGRNIFIVNNDDFSASDKVGELLGDLA